MFDHFANGIRGRHVEYVGVLTDGGLQVRDWYIVVYHGH